MSPSAHCWCSVKQAQVQLQPLLGPVPLLLPTGQCTSFPHAQLLLHCASVLTGSIPLTSLANACSYDASIGEQYGSNNPLSNSATSRMFPYTMDCGIAQVMAAPRQTNAPCLYHGLWWSRSCASWALCFSRPCMRVVVLLSPQAWVELVAGPCPPLPVLTRPPPLLCCRTAPSPPAPAPPLSAGPASSSTRSTLPRWGSPCEAAICMHCRAVGKGRAAPHCAQSPPPVSSIRQRSAIWPPFSDQPPGHPSPLHPAGPHRCGDRHHGPAGQHVRHLQARV